LVIVRVLIYFRILKWREKVLHYSVHRNGRRTKTVGIPGPGLYIQQPLVSEITKVMLIKEEMGYLLLEREQKNLFYCPIGCRMFRQNKSEG
jgi:hypothetical protein